MIGSTNGMLVGAFPSCWQCQQTPTNPLPVWGSKSTKGRGDDELITFAYAELKLISKG